MDYSSELIKVAIVTLLAVMSPGPDFVLIARNSLVGSRRAGIFSALGLATGVLVHVTYALAGIALILSQTPWMITGIRYAGAAYLVYLGVQSIRFAGNGPAIPGESGHTVISDGKAWRMGLMNNVLNPKATLFMFSLFTQVIEAHVPFSIQLVMGVELALITVGWFSLLAIGLSLPWVRAAIRGVQAQIDRVLGAVLLGLGVVLFM